MRRFAPRSARIWSSPAVSSDPDASVLLMGGDNLLSTRMYTGWRTLWPGFAKNLVDTFGGPLPTLAVATAAFLLGWTTFAIPALDFAGWMHGADGANRRAVARTCRFRRGHRATCRRRALFPDSVLVRSDLSAGLYRGRADGVRQRPPSSQRSRKLERPYLFMTAVKRKSEEAPPTERVRVAGPLDTGETRAVLIGAVLLAVFLYWIKLILLPFVLAAIVAYICTPLLDWATRRTRWPRLLFAIVLFRRLGRRHAGGGRFCRAAYRRRGSCNGGGFTADARDLHPRSDRRSADSPLRHDGERPRHRRIGD